MSSSSERVTWETCPGCGRAAAVGWRDGMPVRTDCPGGCGLTAGEFVRAPGAVRPSSSVARWAAVARTWA
ncbi:hypothetical protein GCU56_05785 [Geodermatophilus sabuli]|uniref:Uncharacterized protein n=1 Tax=Geodermatophilus sabuli TaxID=1564158 RepID=A0A7K3VZ43_9ACTN|nr:hypothetical protein [Geodermatophilus sabuli]NEK57383.1 hypothetical protein [Geodermatophilus sabuli]